MEKMSNQERYWLQEAKSTLRAELERRDISYARLVKRLQKQGVTTTERAIANKISRGSFSFVFFLQVMRAIEAELVIVTATQRIDRVQFSGPAESKNRSQDCDLT
ncbi:DUF6471 domain-containing protein [Deefgea piscis]|uniref:DUF6471 domain-containing protein n=1 Tax=Deefgea piscis TaxID=2739061 RepID=UPI001C808A12|nr:DUF6471 domain-containing protein [Deefgea piscis]QZA82267.1 hypothetical protein K4H25_06390 [Deefgea piscis]